jgi:hypothetical protein
MIRLRPASFAAYRAASARRINASDVSAPSHSATPAENV